MGQISTQIFTLSGSILDATQQAMLSVRWLIASSPLLNVALTASGLLELVSDSPAAVELAPGVRTTLF
ncbi:hypothetical protein E2K66_23450, partial [Escherichia coli]